MSVENSERGEVDTGSGGAPMRECDLGAGMSGWNGEERTPPVRETAKCLWSAFLRGLDRNRILILIHVYTIQWATFLSVHV